MHIDENTSVRVIMKGRAGKGEQLVVGQREHTLLDAQKLFLDFDLHHLPIVESDDDHTLVGIVSATDLLKHYVSEPGDNPRSVTLGSIMTLDPMTIHPTTEIRTAVRTLAKSRFQSLPVVDDDRRVVGIVTTRDIVRYLNNEYEDDIYNSVQQTIAAASLRP